MPFTAAVAADPWLSPRLQADLILYGHFLYVLAVVLPVPIIIIGYYRRWRWIRSPGLRFLHLGLIGAVVLLTLFDLPCPLTVWEQDLRDTLDEGEYSGSFLSHWITRLLFYEFDPWVFNLAYLLFGALVLFLLFMVKPVLSDQRNSKKD